MNMTRAIRKSKSTPSYRKLGKLTKHLSPAVTEALAEAVTKVADISNRSEALIWYGVNQVTLHANSRAKTRFGCYRPRRFELEINAQLFTDTPQMREEFERTLLHEMGHMLDHLAFSNAGHGRTWRVCMTALGQPDEERCGEAGILEENHRWTLECVKCDKTYKRHRRPTAGRYRCGRCRKGELEAVDNRSSERYSAEFREWVPAT